MIPDATSDMTHDMTPDTTRDSAAFVVTITEAAKLLGLSVRTVQRRLDAGEWEAVTVAGKRCVRLPASEVPDGVTPDATSDIVDSITLNPARDVPHDTTSRAMVPVSRQGDAVAALVAALIEAQAARPATVPIEAKPLLTMAEAQALTGLSRSTLRAAIEANELKAQRVGRAIRIKRTNLDRYIKEL